jgi:hypothetical protein
MAYHDAHLIGNEQDIDNICNKPIATPDVEHSGKSEFFARHRQMLANCM